MRSYLGYGLMAGRAKVIEAFTGGSEGHPCFGAVYDVGPYKYAGQEYPVKAAKEAQFAACAKVGAESLDVKAKCGADQVCVWGVGGRAPRSA